jgi:hypothetical protein
MGIDFDKLQRVLHGILDRVPVQNETDLSNLRADVSTLDKSDEEVNTDPTAVTAENPGGVVETEKETPTEPATSGANPVVIDSSTETVSPTLTGGTTETVDTPEYVDNGNGTYTRSADGAHGYFTSTGEFVASA